MPRTDPVSGQIYFGQDDVVQDVLFNGQSALGMQLLEVMIDPKSGHGYIMCLRTLDNPEKAPKKMIDGQYLTHTYYGAIEVIP